MKLPLPEELKEMLEESIGTMHEFGVKLDTLIALMIEIRDELRTTNR